ncbi:trypsin-like peptidase domain-containing protein [Radiobacillus sp. PE A8.2]|uniref:S1C family serine protease n=1 Tax=Radiobacillus sp. PE A8.2 TaxID=3380349 RepID=UPI003890C444
MNNNEDYHRNDNQQHDDTYNNEQNDKQAPEYTYSYGAFTNEQENTEDNVQENTAQHIPMEEVSESKTEEPVVPSSQQRTNQKQPKRNGVLGHIISGVTGGLSVAIAGTVLFTTGVIPLEQLGSTPEVNQSGITSPEATPTSSIVRTVNMGDTDLSGAIENVSEAVVGVANIQQASLWTESQDAGTGSGVIYKKENGKAYVVTNNHVVEGAGALEVILASGERVEAQLLGADQLTDLAVLEIDASKVTQVATLGTSDNLIIGETAIAIGNPLGTDFAGSVTKGIISGLERSVDIDLNSDGVSDWTTEVIQTDAAINPGNSGGALIDANGEVIGINSMKVALQAVEGIGFAIPIDAAKPIIEQLETNGSVSRPFMGITAVGLDTVPTRNKQQTLQLSEDVTEGIVIAQVQPNTPADQAGIEQYDVVTEVDGQPISSMMDLKKYLYNDTKIGDSIEITFYRDGTQQTTTLTLSNQGTEAITN